MTWTKQEKPFEKIELLLQRTKMEGAKKDVIVAKLSEIEESVYIPLKPMSWCYKVLYTNPQILYSGAEKEYNQLSYIIWSLGQRMSPKTEMLHFSVRIPAPQVLEPRYMRTLLTYIRWFNLMCDFFGSKQT